MKTWQSLYGDPLCIDQPWVRYWNAYWECLFRYIWDHASLRVWQRVDPVLIETDGCCAAALGEPCDVVR